MTSLMISCNALFSFFKPSSNATAFPPHRLRRKPLTETPRHGENFSAGTPTSSSASAPRSDDSVATPPNPVRQNARPILALAGFKRVIKYQEFMPDPSDKTLCDDSTATPRNPVRQNARPILAFDGFKRVISVIKYQEFMPTPLTWRWLQPSVSARSMVAS
jgi:hypothetical protein